jgi:hypothetical protein
MVVAVQQGWLAAFGHVSCGRASKLCSLLYQHHCTSHAGHKCTCAAECGGAGAASSSEAAEAPTVEASALLVLAGAGSYAAPRRRVGPCRLHHNGVPDPSQQVIDFTYPACSHACRCCCRPSSVVALMPCHSNASGIYPAILLTWLTAWSNHAT